MPLRRALLAAIVLVSCAQAQTRPPLQVPSLTITGTPSAATDAARMADIRAALPSAPICTLYGGSGTAGSAGAVAIGASLSCVSGVLAVGSVPLSSLVQSGATSGQVLSWNGSAWAPITPSSGGGASYTLPPATSSVLGGIKLGSTLATNSGTGLTDVVTATPVALSGSVLSSDTILIQRGSTVYYATPAQIPASLFAGGGGGTTPTPATTYTTAQSASSGSTGTGYTVTLTPGSGGWPAVPVSVATSGAAATVSAAQTPAANSTTPLTFTVTPTAAGTVVATPSASGMTSTPTTLSYTASVAATYTFGTGKFSQAIVGGNVTLPVSFASGTGRSFQFWYKAPSAPGDGSHPILSMSDGSAFGVSVGGSATVSSVGDTTIGSNTNATMSDGAWHWMTAYLPPGGSWSVWQDGSLVICCGSNNTLGAISNIVVTAQGGTGAYVSASSLGYGQIDDLRIGTTEPSDKSPPTAPAAILSGTTVYRFDGNVSAAQ